uniref:C2H2-type domain-containing protein n=1 Tax=Strongyloides stercoralis TaxID=6248 RepID=A0A0K0EQV9_STRER
MDSETILKELNDAHCTNVIDLLNITNRLRAYRKCRLCSKKFAYSRNCNNVYQHCVMHEELREIIKLNIPGSCYNNYIKFASGNVQDSNDNFKNISNDKKNEVKDKLSILEKVEMICTIKRTFESSDMLTSQKDVTSKIERKNLLEDVSDIEKSIEDLCNNNPNDSIILKSPIKNISYEKSFKDNCKIDVENEYIVKKNDKLANGLLTSKSSLNFFNVNSSNFPSRSYKIFKQTSEYGLTQPTSNGKFKCSNCDLIYPYKVCLKDIYIHSAGHNELFYIMKKMLKPSYLRVIKNRMRKIENKKKIEVGQLENKNKYIAMGDSLKNDAKNIKEEVSNQPNLAVIEKLRFRPFETDVINLTHVDFGYRICNECKALFSLNDRPYTIYKHCFHHKSFHKILIDNVQHDVLLEMIMKARREKKKVQKKQKGIINK